MKYDVRKNFADSRLRVKVSSVHSQQDASRFILILFLNLYSIRLYVMPCLAIIAWQGRFVKKEDEEILRVKKEDEEILRVLLY